MNKWKLVEEWTAPDGSYKTCTYSDGVNTHCTKIDLHTGQEESIENSDSKPAISEKAKEVKKGKR